MGRHYSREELLGLRQSPLVCKPAGLPPAEEWMGPPPDPSQNTAQTRGSRITTRGKPDDALQADGALPKRLTQDSRNKSVPSGEALVLGPPRTSFASTGRKSVGPYEMSQKSSSGLEEPDGSRDRKDASFRGGTRHERSTEPSKESRYGATGRTRGEKLESDWAASRQKLSQGTAFESSYKRVEGRDLGKERRDDKLQGDVSKSGYRNGLAGGSDRQQAPGRGRSEPSWFKSDEERDHVDDRDQGRSRQWRDRESGLASRDPPRRLEQDPEWMDEPALHENKQARTQDDFEQWKAKMKANSGSNGVVADAKENKAADDTENLSKVEQKAKSGKTGKPLLLNSRYDAFLSFGEASSQGNPVVTGTDDGQAQVASSRPGKLSKTSKFRGLFDPMPEPVQKPEIAQVAEPAPQPDTKLQSDAADLSKLFSTPPSQDSSAEDKAGFARILSLLGQQQHPGPENALPPPANDPLPKQYPRSPLHSPSASGNQKWMNLVGQKSPPSGQMPSKDSEFLLNLMQQRSDVPRAQPSRTPSDIPGNLLLDRLVLSSPDHQSIPARDFPTHIFPDSMRDGILTNEKASQGQMPDKRPPPGFPEMPWSGHPQRPPQPPGFPPGMARPPGLDSFGGGFPTRGPPPGFTAPSRPNNVPLGTMPGMMPDRGPPFNMRPAGPGVPPQGFINVNGPPPGLPGALFPQENVPFGGGGGFGEIGHGGQGFGQHPRR